MPQSQIGPIMRVILSLLGYVGLLMSWQTLALYHTWGSFLAASALTVVALALVNTTVFEFALVRPASEAEPTVSVRVWYRKGDSRVRRRSRLFGIRSTTSFYFVERLKVTPAARAAARHWAWSITAVFALATEAVLYKLTV